MPYNEKSRANLVPWKPGQHGGSGGRKKGSKNLTTLIREAAEKRYLMGQSLEGMSAGEALAESMYYHAIKGNYAYCREILDRIEGKVSGTPIDGAESTAPKRIVIPDADDRPEPDAAGGCTAEAGAPDPDAAE